MFVVASNGVNFDCTLGVNDIEVRQRDIADGFGVSTMFGTREGVNDGEMVDNDNWPDDETGDGISFSEAGDDIDTAVTSLSSSTSILVMKTE